MIDTPIILKTKIKNGNYYVASCGCEIAEIIIKSLVLVKSGIKEKYRERIVNEIKASKQDFYKCLLGIYGERMTNQLYKYCELSESLSSSKLTMSLKNKLKRKSIIDYCHGRIYGFKYIISHIFVRNGIVVYVYGNFDKKLVERISKDFDSLFSHRIYIYEQRVIDEYNILVKLIIKNNIIKKTRKKSLVIISDNHNLAHRKNNIGYFKELYDINFKATEDINKDEVRLFKLIIKQLIGETIK